MTIIDIALLIAAALAVVRVFRPPKKPPGRAARPPLTETEKERRRRESREIAALEIDHLLALRERYNKESAALEKELAEETAESKRNKIMTRLTALDEKVYRTEIKIAKLQNILND